MLTLYCDDSGTHPESNYAVAACFLSDMDRWDRFNDDWNRANQDENFGRSHGSICGKTEAVWIKRMAG